MIYLILGNNSYKVEQEIASLEKQYDLHAERLDTTSVELANLADVMRGQSLFARRRFVVYQGLSQRKDIWEKAVEWANEVADDMTIAFVETKLDRRTKAYKTLTKTATVITADRWRDRDRGLAEEWLRQRTKQQGVGLSPAQVSNMVLRARVPVEGESYLEIDQAVLAHALASLGVLDEVTDEAIATVLPPATQDTVFDLLTFATERNTSRLMTLLDELRLNDEPQRVFALIATQWSQLVALALGDAPTAVMATELGIHPYVAQKLRELTPQFTRAQFRTITTQAARLDTGMKTSQFQPWDGVERLLLAIALRT